MQKRTIDKIILHCSDSDSNFLDSIEAIRKIHVKERGWQEIGYHYYITRDGQIHPGRLEQKMGAHCFGENASSLGICLHGRDIFEEAQFEGAAKLIGELMIKYNIPKSKIYPHNHFTHYKTCPNFDIEEIRKRL